MLLILLAITLTFWLLIRQQNHRKRLPPGPTPIPIIGNLLGIVYRTWREGGIVPMLTYYRKGYGDVYTLWIGPIPHVSITDYDICYEVFVKNATKYATKYQSPIFEHLREGNGLFFSNGDRWQELRRFSMQTFRNMGMGKDLMEEKIMRELNARCLDIDKRADKDGVTVQNAGHFFDVTVGSVINNMLLGVGFDEGSRGDFLKFKHLLDSVFEAFSPIDVMLPVWVIKYLMPWRYKVLYDQQMEIMDYVAEDGLKRLRAFREGTHEIDPEHVEDYVDAFLLKMRQDTEGRIYNEKTLKAAILDLWITGQETTTTTLLVGFNRMLHCPDVMKKLREELLKVTGGTRPLSLQDKNNTPYFTAVLAEVQRHASILNVNFWRFNHEATVIGGHPVDAGALVCAQIGAMHVHEKIYEDPEKFDPGRFLRNEKLAQRVIPFGIGKRACLGEALARAELYLIFGNLLLRYDFRIHDSLPSTKDMFPYSALKRPDNFEMQFIRL